MSSGRPAVLKPAVAPFSLMTRLCVGLLWRRKTPWYVWKPGTMISPWTTCSISVPSHVPSLVRTSFRTLLALGKPAEENAAPIARCGQHVRRAADRRVVGRVEGAAGAVLVVVLAGEDDPVAGGPLGDDLAADLRLEACAVELDDHARIDFQA